MMLFVVLYLFFALITIYLIGLIASEYIVEDYQFLTVDESTGDLTILDSKTNLTTDGNGLKATGNFNVNGDLTVNGDQTNSNKIISNSIESYGALKGGATTVTSLNAGTGTIQTTGALKGGATTVTSLSAGSGTIQTTGELNSNILRLTEGGVSRDYDYQVKYLLGLG